jgi:hypothetical protein
MPGLLNKISKFFEPLIDSLPSMSTLLNVIKSIAPAVGTVAAAIPGVGAIAPLVGNLVGSAAGSLGDAYSDYKGGKSEGVDTIKSILDTVNSTIGGGKALYKDYKATKKSGPQVKNGPPKKPLLLSKKIMESVV